MDYLDATFGEVPRFDPNKLRRALVVRELTPHKAAQQARIDHHTMLRALRGEPIRWNTYYSITRMLRRVRPETVGGDDVGDLLADGESSEHGSDHQPSA